MLQAVTRECVRSGFRLSRTAGSRAASAARVHLCLRRIPSGGAHGAAARVTVHFDARFEQRLAEGERHALAGAFERQEMQDVVAQREIEAAALGQIHEQLEVRLPVLNDPRPAAPCHPRQR